MKRYIDCGRIFEGFTFLPSLGLSWVTVGEKRYYNVQFAWLLWYVTFGKKCEDIFKD